MKLQVFLFIVFIYISYSQTNQNLQVNNLEEWTEIGEIFHNKNQNFIKQSYESDSQISYYQFSYSYKRFQSYYIANNNDQVIPQIQLLVQEKFKTFINANKIVGAFRKYLKQLLQYAVVFKSQIGKNFQVICHYNKTNNKIVFSELKVCKLQGEPTNKNNCEESQKYNCIKCKNNYSLYKGRCHLVQDQCKRYDPEECFQCIQGFLLSQGKCLQFQQNQL